MSRGLSHISQAGSPGPAASPAQVRRTGMVKQQIPFPQIPRPPKWVHLFIFSGRKLSHVEFRA